MNGIRVRLVLDVLTEPGVEGDDPPTLVHDMEIGAWPPGCADLHVVFFHGSGAYCCEQVWGASEAAFLLAYPPFWRLTAHRQVAPGELAEERAHWMETHGFRLATSRWEPWDPFNEPWDPFNGSARPDS
jgi:hypothetical protein